MTKSIILILLQFLFLITAQTPDDNELLFVTVIHRHGDRSPIRPYPNDIYSNDSYWPMGWGQLTNKGKQHMYQLGEWLRKYYNNFLPEKYLSKDIYVLSSDRDRTIASALSVLAALYYPTSKEDIWDPNLKWQPLPVHSLPSNYDAMIAYDKKCPCYEYERLELLKTEDVKLKLHEITPLFDYIYTAINTTYDKVDEKIKMFITIYDNLSIQLLNNLKLPEWAKSIFPNRMRPYFNYLFKLNSYTTKMQRLHSGLLLREIVDRYDQKINRTLSPDRKMWIYSAHDTTIVDFFMTMGYKDSDDIMPGFGSAIILELYKQKNQYYIKMLYKKRYSDEAVELPMFKCDKYCPLDEWKTLLEPYLITPERWEVECREIPVPYSLTVATTILISFVGLFMIGFIFVCCCKRAITRRLNVNKFF